VLGVRTGYDPDEVDALIRRIEGTLGRGRLDGPPITADEIRRARFRTRLGGYHEIAVDFALEAFIVAVETRQKSRTPAPSTVSPVPSGDGRSREKPGEEPGEKQRGKPGASPGEKPGASPGEQPRRKPGASPGEKPGRSEADPVGDPHPTGEMLAEAWFESQAERVERVVFRQGRLGMGYSEDEVDAFLDRIVATLRGTTDEPISAEEVRSAAFATVLLKPGYATAEVDAFLSEIADVLEHRIDK
jgi:DivIVA domain-containing protein